MISTASYLPVCNCASVRNNFTIRGRFPNQGSCGRSGEHHPSYGDNLYEDKEETRAPNHSPCLVLGLLDCHTGQAARNSDEEWKAQAPDNLHEDKRRDPRPKILFLFGAGVTGLSNRPHREKQPSEMGGASSRQQVAEAENATFFTKEELNKLKSDFETGGVNKVTSLIEQKLSELDKTKLNIAVTGETGTGKSTFINAMRGLRNTDEGAAVGWIRETTKEPTGYRHPNLPNVCYWDLPGIGSIQVPASRYVWEMKFERYDFFIILSAGRFKENDAKLAKEIKRLGKNFYFVRSKIDQDFYSMRMERKKINEEKVLENIRSDCIRRLKEAGILNPTVFLISSFEQDQYDFNQLNKTLEDDLPFVMKSTFVLAYPNRNVEIVRQKSKMLRERVWMLATLSGAVGAIPIPGVSFACDISILITGIINFRKCLCLDEASLQRLANITNKPVEELKAVINPSLLGKIDKNIIIRLGWGATVVAISALEFGLDFIPVIGSIFGAGSSFLMTYTILTDALKDLTESAQRVVKVAYGID
ncbi:interferon-inducible GTPase 5-like isoform X2 [Hemitrygon akajei]|uniref:interferon-inducible GTPase 5-like isoform X2 n=1 Tax=Hemitrygon akajei TaxID=2704970 RepID=UPI003BFA0D64